ncbi:hypothetical protein BOW25_06230 [Solemya velum gill symbiont]|nr:hypothetical protein BOW25_06230 [Solemya velum gill symbiont]
MRLAVLCLITTLFTGCSHHSVQQRIDRIDALAASQGWESALLRAEGLPMVAFSPRQLHSTKRLFIYIEGDGKAWRTRTLSSDNPTPANPLGLKLALAHLGNNAVYLGRPCQTIFDRHACNPELWLGGRFSETAIRATSQAIGTLKQRFQAEELVLVGYSGGGAVAALVAARRNDVAGLISVAGNLDHRTWTQYHGVTTLSRSLNPMDYTEKLKPVRQFHFFGTEDKTVPPAVAQSFQTHFERPVIYPVAGNTHSCCWIEQWPELLKNTFK